MFVYAEFELDFEQCMFIAFFQIVKNNPILVISWEGTNPNLPAVLLNSHTDVVPVFPVSFDSVSYIFLLW